MSKSAKLWMVIAIALFIVIIVMTYLLVTIPVPVTNPVATTTPTVIKEVPSEPVKPNPNAPLRDRVKVTSPARNATVGVTFAVKGEAPGNWYFEASFPIQVRDKDGNVIARTYASALTDWMTTEQVAFSSNIIVEGSYRGPATLILLKDNPSGLPEHDDALEIPIVIQ